MNKLLILLTVLIPLLSAAQSPFAIKATGEVFKDGDKIYLVYRAADKIVMDSTRVVGNSFQFSGLVNGRSKGTLYRNENPMLIAESHDSEDVYVEPGTTILTARDSMHTAELSGTSTNADLYKLNTTLKSYYTLLAKVNTDYEALSPQQQEDINVVAKLRADLKRLNDEMAPLKFAFISGHPKSYISLVTLAGLKNDEDLMPRVSAAFDSLSDDLKQSEEGIALQKAISAGMRSAVGMIAADFTQPNTLGKPVKLSSFRGKYVLIDFWASWCLPCRAENPFVVAAYKKYKSKGFTVIGVSLDDKRSRAAWLKAIKADGLTWTQVSDLKGWNNAAAGLYGIKQIPSNLLIGPDGKVIAKNIKDQTLQNKLQELLAPGQQ